MDNSIEIGYLQGYIGFREFRRNLLVVSRE